MVNGRKGPASGQMASALLRKERPDKSRRKVPCYDPNTVSPRRNDPDFRTKMVPGVLEEIPPEGAKFPAEKKAGMARAYYNGRNYH